MSAASEAMDRKLDAFSIVAAAMTAQTKKHGYTATPANPEMSPMVKLAILTEEVGEVAHELCEALQVGQHRGHLNPAYLREELAQVAAVSIAWIESLLAPQPLQTAPAPECKDEDA